MTKEIMNSQIVRSIAKNHDYCTYSLLGSEEKYNADNPFPLICDYLINPITLRYLHGVLDNPDRFDFIMIRSPQDIELCSRASRGQNHSTFLITEDNVIRDLTRLELIRPKMSVTQTAQTVLDSTKHPLIFPIVNGKGEYKVRMVTSPRLVDIVSENPFLYQVHFMRVMILSLGYLRLMKLLKEERRLSKFHFEGHRFFTECKRLAVWLEGFFLVNYGQESYIDNCSNLQRSFQYYQLNPHLRNKIFTYFISPQ